jgi:hypothetical protein
MTRIIIYDRTAPRLSTIWAIGSRAYRALGGFDAISGVASWDEALDTIAAHPEPISELQYWGHGKWGRVLVGNDSLGVTDLQSSRRAKLEAVRERLAPDALVWLRTCETFGARAGLEFAERFADFFGARVAGHTYVIELFQSGLHVIAPGMRAEWDAHEGLVEGTVDLPRRAAWSRPWSPRTVTALDATIPRRFLSLR